MGIWQGIKDNMWLAECDVRITEYAPQHIASAKEFCSYHKDLLLMLRSEGRIPHEAVISTCILMVNAIAEGKGDTHPHLQNHFMVAYQTGYGFLNRWPNIQIDNDYAIRMFRVMARVDRNIWQSPLAQSMSALLEEDSKRFG